MSAGESKKYFVKSIDVRGIKYEIYLYPETEFKDRFPNCLAEMSENPFEIRFNEEHIEKDVIKHELFHCYMASCFLTSQEELTSGDAEEVACDVFAYFSTAILDEAERVYLSLKAELNDRMDR